MLLIKMILNMLKIYRWNNHMYLQSVTKNMVKTATWTISCFYHLPSLNNVEKQWAKLASSYVMGASSYVMRSQHCIGKEEGFLNTLLKIPILFCHDLSEIYKKNKQKTKQRWGSMHAVSDNLNLLYWVWLCHTTHYHEHNDRKWRQTDA